MTTKICQAYRTIERRYIGHNINKVVQKRSKCVLGARIGPHVILPGLYLTMIVNMNKSDLIRG